MKITQALLDNLTAQAKESPRLRMNLDLRNDEHDGSQRMLNAIEPGSPLPIHRHQKTSETVVCLRGRLVEEYYQELKVDCLELKDSSEVQSSRVQKVQEIELSPGGPVVALNIPAGQWHTVQALESGTVILEMKDGAYEPIGPEDILQM
jgi:cupin fold WbuC family metalloprotein